MKTININSTKIFTYIFWILILSIGLKFILEDAFPFLSVDREVLGRFFEVKIFIITHVSCGILAMVLGPFQLSKSFRRRYVITHRRLGYIYIIAILLGSIVATYMAWTTGLAVHWSWALALQASAFVWLTCVLLAFRAIRQKRFNQHREWMIKSYVSTYSFVFFRLMNDSSYAEHLGNFIERGSTLGWMSFAIPIFITEIILQWNKK